MMNRQLFSGLLAAAALAGAGSAPSPLKLAANRELSPVAAGGVRMRHGGNNKSPKLAAKRHAAKRIAKLSRRRNRGK